MIVRWTVLFLGIAAAAALLGFGMGLAGVASGAAQILFVVFFFLALAMLIFNHGLPDS